jgi:hypothetical protein
MGSLLGDRQEQLRLHARNAIQLCRTTDVSGDATRRQFWWAIVVGRFADATRRASHDATHRPRAEALNREHPAIPVWEVGAWACRRLDGRVVVKGAGEAGNSGVKTRPLGRIKHVRETAPRYFPNLLRCSCSNHKFRMRLQFVAFRKMPLRFDDVIRTPLRDAFTRP